MISPEPSILLQGVSEIFVATTKTYIDNCAVHARKDVVQAEILFEGGVPLPPARDLPLQKLDVKLVGIGVLVLKTNTAKVYDMIC